MPPRPSSFLDRFVHRPNVVMLDDQKLDDILVSLAFLHRKVDHLTQESHIMKQALTDLLAAVAALSTEVTSAVTSINEAAQTIAGADDSKDIEAAVATINSTTANLTAAVAALKPVADAGTTAAAAPAPEADTSGQAGTGGAASGA